MTVEYVIRCDVCDDVIDASSASAAAARRAIRAHGQARVRPDGRFDLCANHKGPDS